MASIPPPPAHLTLDQIQMKLEETNRERVSALMSRASTEVTKVLNDRFAQDLGANHGMGMSIVAAVSALTESLAAHANYALNAAASKRLVVTLQDMARELKL